MSKEAAPPPFDGFRRIDSFAAISEALRSPAVAQRPRPYADPLEAETLFKLSGDRHRARRHLESKLFKPAALQTYERTVLRPAIERAMEELATHREADGLVRGDLVQLSRRMVMPVTGTIIGLDSVDSFESSDDLWDLLVACEMGIKVYFLPGDPQPVIQRALAAKSRYWEQYVRPSMDRRLKLLATEGSEALPVDLLSLLIQDRGVTEDWDDDLILRECILYLVASGSTTSILLGHVLVELERWLETHPADRERLTDDDFLPRFIDETLRLHPPSAALLRDCPAGFSGQHVELKAEEPVYLSLAKGNTDEEMFGPDACAFNPHRQVPEGTPRHGLAFGMGRHLCIGRPLAAGGQGAGTAGSTVLILRRLLDAGVALDPDRPPTYMASVDKYDELPIVFRDL